MLSHILYSFIHSFSSSFQQMFIENLLCCAVLCVLSCFSHVRLFCDPMGCSPPGSSVHGDSPGKNTRVGCRALLQGIFPTQESNPHLQCLLHCRQVLYPRSHLGSPSTYYTRHYYRCYRYNREQSYLLMFLKLTFWLREVIKLKKKKRKRINKCIVWKMGIRAN